MNAAARQGSLQRLRRLFGLRHARAQRLLLAARCEEFVAESALSHITAQLDTLRREDARCAREAHEGPSVAALQAAQQRGAQLRREAEAQQPARRLAEQRLARCRVERERAARRLRSEQVRQDWFDSECRRAQVRALSVQTLSADATAQDRGVAWRAMA